MGKPTGRIGVNNLLEFVNTSGAWFLCITTHAQSRKRNRRERFGSRKKKKSSSSGNGGNQTQHWNEMKVKKLINSFIYFPQVMTVVERNKRELKKIVIRIIWNKNTWTILRFRPPSSISLTSNPTQFYKYFHIIITILIYY